MSFSFYLSYSVLPPHHIIVGTLLESTPRQQQHWAFGFCPLGFFVRLIPFISPSLSELLLQSAFLKKKKNPFFYSANWRQTPALPSRTPPSLSVSLTLCLLHLRRILSSSNTQRFSLPLGSSVSFNYFLTVFIASSLVVLSCSCHLWPHSPGTLLLHYFCSLCFI